MISDEELSELPVDPELAFVQFEKIMRGRVQAEEEHAHEHESDPDTYRLEYMNKVAAAAQAFRIEALSNLSVPRSSTIGYGANVHEHYRDFTRKVDFVTIQIRIRSAQSNREGSVGLDSTSKARIHHFIQQIREIIQGADLPEDKRDALFGKLNAFAAEIDRSRTRLQAAAAVFIAVCHTIGEGFEKLEPARKWLDSIGRVLGQAKEGEDRADNMLSPPSERKRLVPPPDIPLIAPPDDDIRF
jgi:hypothetical protein